MVSIMKRKTHQLNYFLPTRIKINDHPFFNGWSNWYQLFSSLIYIG